MLYLRNAGNFPSMLWTITPLDTQEISPDPAPGSYVTANKFYNHFFEYICNHPPASVSAPLFDGESSRESLEMYNWHEHRWKAMLVKF